MSQVSDLDRRGHEEPQVSDLDQRGNKENAKSPKSPTLVEEGMKKMPQVSNLDQRGNEENAPSLRPRSKRAQ